MMKKCANISNAPNIGIIGAGPCGLAVAKNLLQQGMTNFIVFEKNSCLGGNWIYGDFDQHSSVYETTHLISSKCLSAYEDFPMPASYPDYPSHSQILAYFNDYAEHFGLTAFIRFNTEVERVMLCADSRWHVNYRDASGVHQIEFDYFFVANGHHWDPAVPNYPGKFSGKLLHSHLYKTALPFKDKRVLVVGAGNSACDIAVEVGRIALATGISIRNSRHIFPKFIFGKPTDMAFAAINWLPFWCKQYLSAFVIRILQGRYAKYNLKQPVDKPLVTHPTINSELLYSIRHGKVAPHAGIERFDGECVYFVDGTKECFDAVIFATGYKISFPFFNKKFLNYDKLAHIRLYKKMIHPGFENLYFIGLFQPQGCIWPLADYQAKIAVRLILNKSAGLLAKIKKETVSHSDIFKNSKNGLEVDYHVFRKQLLDELRANS